MNQTETVIYLSSFSITTIATLATIYGVLIRKWLKNQKYTRMTVSLLIFSLLHDIGVSINYFLADLMNVWIYWVISIIGVSTLIAYMVAILELLNLFSPIAPFWTPSKVFHCQIFFIVLMAILNLPVLVFPVQFYFEGTALELFLNVSIANIDLLVY